METPVFLSILGTLEHLPAEQRERAMGMAEEISEEGRQQLSDDLVEINQRLKESDREQHELVAAMQQTMEQAHKIFRSEDKKLENTEREEALKHIEQSLSDEQHAS